MIKTALLAMMLSISTVALAGAPKGFHEGPYFTLNGGTVYYTADNNARTGEKVGRDFEPALGFNFGWNITDYFAPELQARYITDKNNGRREHIVSVNLNAALFYISNELTKWKNLKILPFVQAGPMAQFSSLPGDSLAGNSNLFVWGPGLGIGAGLRFLVSRYGYLGISAQSDFVHLSNRKQNISGVPVTVISGGWDIQPSFLALAGAHF